MVVFGLSGCFRVKVFVLGQKVVVFVQSGCIGVKVVVFGQNGCIRAEVVVLGQKWF